MNHSTGKDLTFFVFFFISHGTSKKKTKSAAVLAAVDQRGTKTQYLLVAGGFDCRRIHFFWLKINRIGPSLC